MCARCCGATTRPASSSRTPTSRSSSRAAPRRRGGRDLELTRREAELLELLLRNARGVVTRELALERVWGGEAEASANVVDRYVAYLRRKLGEPPLIHTVRGVGFRLRREAPGTCRGGGRRGDRPGGGRAGRRRARPARRPARRRARPRAARARRPRSRGWPPRRPDLLLEPGALDGRLGGSALLVEVIDRRGRIVARSSGLGSRVLPQAAAVRAALEDRRAGYGDALLGSDPLRLYAAPLGELGRGPAAGGAVIVAGTTARDRGDARQHAPRRRARRRWPRRCWPRRSPPALPAARCGRCGGSPRVRARSSAPATSRGDSRVPPTRDEVGDAGAPRSTPCSARSSAPARPSTGSSATPRTSCGRRSPRCAATLAYVARHGADAEVAARAEADAARLSALLDDLLALAREDAAAPAGGEEVDLGTLARERRRPTRTRRPPTGASSCAASGRRSSAPLGTSCATRDGTGRGRADRDRRSAGRRPSAR